MLVATFGKQGCGSASPIPFHLQRAANLIHVHEAIVSGQISAGIAIYLAEIDLASDSNV